MNRRAWAYVWGIYLLATLLGVQAFAGWNPGHANLPLIEVLFGLAIGAQLFKVEAPNHVLFYATPVFFFAGAILLDPALLFLLIAVAHGAEWLKERWLRSSHLSAWYLQPFNVAMYWIACRAAQLALLLGHGHVSAGTGWDVAVLLSAGMIYVIANHSILGVALVLARGVHWGESGILDGSSFVNDFVLVCVGSIVGALWLTDRWLILPALAPIAFMYRALMIPQLKRQAETDAKTGLYNARHLTSVFESELDRASRFDRPLAVIMADLDHLREVNNTYGHLAGDAVLTGVAQTIQATMRDYDVASRFGGEEFALLLPEVDEDGARALAERLRHAIERLHVSVPAANIPLQVTMSLGVACYPHDGRTATELLQAADIAVYTAKSAGRNRVVCASEVSALEVASAAAHGPLLDDPIADPEAPPLVVATKEPADRAEDDRASRPWLQAALVTAVILAGLTSLGIGVVGQAQPSPTIIVLLAVLGGLAELLEVDIFGQGTVSVSVGVAFTAALLTGIEGLACVSAVIALTHHLKQRRGLNKLQRGLFNWAVHVLAGLSVVVALSIQHLPLQADNLPILAPVLLTAALLYFLIETGLIATAVALARGESVSRLWVGNYRWLLPHYVVLCLMGLALSVTYKQLGIEGVLFFAAPLLMMHFVQREYVRQNREHVQALQRLNHDLVRAALHDHLTGLGNERGFQEALRREVQAASERRLPLVLARLNIDEFRATNAERGRRYGDGVLMETAQLLARVPSLHHAFRLVADDFAVILANCSLCEAAAVLERFRAAASERLGGATLSVGLAEMELGEQDADLLNQQAVRALGEAKRRGRNVLVSFEDIRDSAIVASWTKAQGLRKLLAEKRIEVAFQPIWDIDRGSILGYEALARPDAEYGFIGPQEAFDVATRIGRATELDTVCREAALGRARELPEGAQLFLNVAPDSLEQGGITGAKLVASVRAAGLHPEQVVLELTERSIVRPDAVVQEVHQLREFGFAFALDDTGAGNAGLGVLSRLHVDYVKIDRSVVNHAGSDQAARAVLAGIFALAREMGAYVIAEGIETQEMLELVRSMSQAVTGVGSRSGRGVQGYLLGAPSLAIPGGTRRSTSPAASSLNIAPALRALQEVPGEELERAVGW